MQLFERVCACACACAKIAGIINATSTDYKGNIGTKPKSDK